ncbi:MAG: MBOAT family O-acyltransferase [Bacteroidia bacterium]
MVFSSLIFLFVFLPLNLLIYYSVPGLKAKNFILVICSLVFYAWGEPIWVSLLVFSALVDYLNGLFIERFRGKKIAFVGVISTLVINLSLLISFKYADFIISNVNGLLGTGFTEPGITLPIGISFYTFQTISYTIDVYRGEVKAQRSFMDFLLFVSLFHQLVAGPIVRYSHIANEISNRIFSWNDLGSGVKRFCKGLFKKVVIANTAGTLATQFLDKEVASMDFAGNWFGLVMYTLQIYFDFSGYSDMAIGLGRMFGFHYHENFNHPYMAKSITDFWRRWHISLSSFFRDYVYIPMGGNRKNVIFNILVVWSLTGLWHGASWNFMLWGLYFAVLLIFEKYVWGRVLEKTPALLRHAYALFFIVVGWALFYFTDLMKLQAFLYKSFDLTRIPQISLELQSAVESNLYWIAFALIMCTPIYRESAILFEKTIRNTTLNHLGVVMVNLIMLVISTAILVESTYNPFLYFRF